jgi:hypothetical protein
MYSLESWAVGFRIRANCPGGPRSKATATAYLNFAHRLATIVTFFMSPVPPLVSSVAFRSRVSSLSESVERG